MEKYTSMALEKKKELFGKRKNMGNFIFSEDGNYLTFRGESNWYEKVEELTIEIDDDRRIEIFYDSIISDLLLYKHGYHKEKILFFHGDKVIDLRTELGIETLLNAEIIILKNNCVLINCKKTRSNSFICALEVDEEGDSRLVKKNINTISSFDRRSNYEVFASYEHGYGYIPTLHILEDDTFKKILEIEIVEPEDKKSEIYLNIKGEKKVKIFECTTKKQAITLTDYITIRDINGDVVTASLLLKSGSINRTVTVVVNIKTFDIIISNNKGFISPIVYKVEDEIEVIAMNKSSKRLTYTNDKKLLGDDEEPIFSSDSNDCSLFRNANNKKYMIKDGEVLKLDAGLISKNSIKDYSIEILLHEKELFIKKKRKMPSKNYEEMFEISVEKITDITDKQREFLLSIEKIIDVENEIRETCPYFQGIAIKLTDLETLYVLPPSYSDDYKVSWRSEINEKFREFNNLVKTLYSYKFDISDNKFKTKAKCKFPHYKPIDDDSERHGETYSIEDKIEILQRDKRELDSLTLLATTI